MFPKSNTIADEMKVDVCAIPLDNYVVILIERLFDRKIAYIELASKSQRLLFAFETREKEQTEKRDLGKALTKELYDIIKNKHEMEICQIDMETKKALWATKVPLKIAN